MKSFLKLFFLLFLLSCNKKEDFQEQVANDCRGEYTKEEIEDLEKQHDEVPHQRLLQKTLAEDITKRVHSEEDLQAAITASNILFGKSTSDDLMSLDEETFLSVFEGVPQFEVNSRGVASATGAFQNPVYADDAARDAAIPTPAAGMTVFNTTNTKLQLYTGAAWVDCN